MAQHNDAAPVAIEPSAFQPLDSTQTRTRRRLSPVQAVLLGTGALFLLAMLFLLTARSLEVVVVAETPADIGVSGLALPLR